LPHVKSRQVKLAKRKLLRRAHCKTAWVIRDESLGS
jgi:hypothetical protein